MKKLTVLLVHNYYLNPGGEDVEFEAEKALLTQKGHKVITYIRRNSEIKNFKLKSLSAFFSAHWSRKTYKELIELIKSTQPDLVHFHNTFLVVSPSAYYACKKMKVPVIQTLQNFRLFCPGATFYRKASLCEDCLNRIPPWPGLWRGCWRNSRLQTAVVASLSTLHHWLKTWQNMVDVYIVQTKFHKKKFAEGGLPEEKLEIKPNMIIQKPKFAGEKPEKRFALFVGRLSPEKGVITLLEAWKSLKNIPLKILGDGPLMNEVKTKIAQEKLTSINLLGWRPRNETIQTIGQANFLIFPSEWYEGLPLTIIEAFASGTPVIASNIGAMSEIIEDNLTGLHFPPGNHLELVEKIKWAWSHPQEMEKIAFNALDTYNNYYAPSKVYETLMKIFAKAMAANSRS